MKRITFAWNPNIEEDLAEYRLYQSSGSGLDGTLVATIPAGTETIQLDVENGIYYFYLTAVDTNGNESDKSNEVEAICIDTTAPVAPSNFHVVSIEEI